MESLSGRSFILKSARALADGCSNLCIGRSDAEATWKTAV
jgi:hypothetical protein